MQNFIKRPFSSFIVQLAISLTSSIGQAVTIGIARRRLQFATQSEHPKGPTMEKISVESVVESLNTRACEVEALALSQLAVVTVTG